MNPFELENHLIPWSNLILSCPTEFLDMAQRLSSGGLSTGVGHHPQCGWFILVTAGQGPVLAFQEKDFAA